MSKVSAEFSVKNVDDFIAHLERGYRFLMNAVSDPQVAVLHEVCSRWLQSFGDCSRPAEAAHDLPVGMDETHKDFERFSALCAPRDAVDISAAVFHDRVAGDGLSDRIFFAVRDDLKSYLLKYETMDRSRWIGPNLIYLREDVEAGGLSVADRRVGFQRAVNGLLALEVLSVVYDFGDLLFVFGNGFVDRCLGLSALAVPYDGPVVDGPISFDARRFKSSLRSGVN